MRMAVLTLGSIGVDRLDSSFHLRRAEVQGLTSGEDAHLCPLAEIVQRIDEGVRAAVTASGLILLRASSVTPCEILGSQVSYIDPADALAEGLLKAGDVVLTRAAESFRAAVIPADLENKSTFSADLTRFRPRPALVPEYLAAILSTSALAKVLDDYSYRGAVRRLRITDIGAIPVPLPPRSVQEEIRRLYCDALDLSHAAHAEFDAVRNAAFAQIDRRISPVRFKDPWFVIRRSGLSGRLDTSRYLAKHLHEELASNRIMVRVGSLARVVPASLGGIADDNIVGVIQVQDIDSESLLVETVRHRPLRDLSERMRQRVSRGQVLICTTGSGRQVAYIDDAVTQTDSPLVSTATLTALLFPSTPRLFALTLTHPIVRQQLDLLAVGAAQPFVTRREFDEVLIPVLTDVWREDFEARLAQAMERRREALEARQKLLSRAEAFAERAMDA
jgi:hypothetical protein